MKWETRYLVGIKAIDEEHQQLFKITERLVAARSDVSDLSNIIEILNELTLYATKHFETEENLMRETNYPDYLKHANNHMVFKEEILHFCQRVMIEGSTDIIGDLLAFLEEWLDVHLIKEDRQYIDHFKMHGIS